MKKLRIIACWLVGLSNLIAPGLMTKPAGTLVSFNDLSATAPTYDEVKGLLSRHTCLFCYQTNKRQVGPAYAEMTKRKYTNDQIIELICNPKPQNWPDYAV